MSCNKFSNKCASGIGINYKNQSKFYLAPTAGFWGTMDGVFQNRTLDNLVQAKGAPNTVPSVAFLFEGNTHTGSRIAIFDNLFAFLAQHPERKGFPEIILSDIAVYMAGIPRNVISNNGPYTDVRNGNTQFITDLNAVGPNDNYFSLDCSGNGGCQASDDPSGNLIQHWEHLRQSSPKMTENTKIWFLCNQDAGEGYDCSMSPVAGNATQFYKDIKNAHDFAMYYKQETGLPVEGVLMDLEPPCTLGGTAQAFENLVTGTALKNSSQGWGFIGNIGMKQTMNDYLTGGGIFLQEWYNEFDSYDLGKPPKVNPGAWDNTQKKGGFICESCCNHCVEEKDRGVVTYNKCGDEVVVDGKGACMSDDSSSLCAGDFDCPCNCSEVKKAAWRYYCAYKGKEYGEYPNSIPMLSIERNDDPNCSGYGNFGGPSGGKASWTQLSSVMSELVQTGEMQGRDKFWIYVPHPLAQASPTSSVGGLMNVP